MTEFFEHPPNLRVTKKIDEGRFGVVVQAVDEAGKIHAIKRIASYATITKKPTAYAKKICREVAILTALNRANCENIVPLDQVYLSEDRRDVYLVMPFVEFNLDHIVHRHRLNEREIKAIAYQLFVGIKSCHERHIMHRDLTLRNILVDPEFNVYLADFGLSRAKETCEEDGTVDVVTLEYRAPELLLCYKKYDARVDMWSIGCMIAEMFLRRRLLAPECRDEPHQVRKIIQLLGEPDLAVVDEYGGNTGAAGFVREIIQQLRHDELVEAPFESIARDLQGAGASAEAIDLLRHLLQFDFRNRFTADQALNSPWFMNDPEYVEDSSSASDMQNNGSDERDGSGVEESNNNNNSNNASGSAAGNGGGGDHVLVGVGNSNNDGGGDAMLRSADADAAPNKVQHHHHHHHHHHLHLHLHHGEQQQQLVGDDAAALVATDVGAQQQHQHQLNNNTQEQQQQPAFVSEDGNNNSNNNTNNTQQVSNQQQANGGGGGDGANTAANCSGSSSSPATVRMAEWPAPLGDDSEPSQESNDVLARIQKAKLPDLVRFMENAAATNIPLVRGEYTTEEAAPEMVLEHSQSPVDS